MEQPARPPEKVTPDLIHRATDELLALVAAALPKRFYMRTEAMWRPCLTALVARMAGMLESMRPLAYPEHQADALVLLRSLYEHVVTFLWLAIDPEPRVDQWYGHTLRRKRTLARMAEPYGVQNLLSEAELREAEEATDMKPLEQLARDVDDYWAPKIRGLHTHPESGTRNLLTLGGLYLAIFRVASRSAHATIESVDPWVLQEPQDRWVVTTQPRGAKLTNSALAIPLFAMALIVGSERLGWPDEADVRAINDGLMLDHRFVAARLSLRLYVRRTEDWEEVWLAIRTVDVEGAGVAQKTRDVVFGLLEELVGEAEWEPQAHWPTGTLHGCEVVRWGLVARESD